MNFRDYTVRANRGDIIEVTLGSQANVLLLDSAGLSAFRSGRRFTHYGGGGWVTRSPHRLQVPRDGTWHVVVYLPGGGAPRSSARVLPGRMPAARGFSAPSLSAIATSAADYSATMAPDHTEPMSKTFDVFISHSSADKEAVVTPLWRALNDRGVRVWVDAGELRIGMSLRREIDRGISNSRFGVVVLSPAFFGAHWPESELDGLVTREGITGGQIILPIWHNVTHGDVARHSPTLAGRLARSTATHSIEDIADEIASVVAVPEGDDLDDVDL